MSENLYNNDHKAVSDAYRDGYDRIRWDEPKPNMPDAPFEITFHGGWLSPELRQTLQSGWTNKIVRVNHDS